MLHLSVPALIKIREGITVNLSTSVSQAVERNVPKRALKKDYKGNPKEATPGDYEDVGTYDVISFWFIGGTSLAYRVGEEIAQEEFDRIASVLDNLQYRTKDDRKPSSEQAVKKA